MNSCPNSYPANAFELFWLQYPRKVAKKTARMAFMKMQRTGEVSFDRLMEAVKNFTQSVRGKDLQYIPYPASWLNGGRWDDELPVLATDTAWKLQRAIEETQRRRMQ